MTTLATERIDDNYTAADIQALEGMEAVRRRTATRRPKRAAVSAWYSFGQSFQLDSGMARLLG